MMSQSEREGRGRVEGATNGCATTALGSAANESMYLRWSSSLIGVEEEEASAGDCVESGRGCNEDEAEVLGLEEAPYSAMSCLRSWRLSSR